MSFLRNHLVLMFIYATATGIYFALLWKQTRHDRIVFFVKVFVGLFVGGIALAWAMYYFPIR